ncbi:metallophosphoesterase family protein [Streptomyces tubercidicus]|uniref:Membrane protein n=1 Tax=Streptomyces tubercidicus TaxID=47759 RepID=A0A640UU11_9ACTN|nr:metallophosphoesterase [Streptomyces tubercidicus]WAU13326.1 metallophosphoesterase [Streptomyces tubercidicus]GFE38910.1 membrane protein [Streptomyces tubercidicus]
MARAARSRTPHPDAPQSLPRRLLHTGSDGVRALPAAVRRGYRSRRTPPTATLPGGTPRRPLPAALGLIAVTVAGAWLGLLLIGSIRVPVGPMDTSMALRPSLAGGTRIEVAPLGDLELRSHHAPVRLDVAVDRLDPVRSQALVDHPERFAGLQAEVTHDVTHGALGLALHSGIAVVSGATALGLAVYRRPRRALAAGGLALTLLAASAGTAYATWNPESVLEPKFSGLLTSAPSVVGNARSIVSEFHVYQEELARLVTNVTKLYDAASTLPVYQPDPTTIRVLHISDIHLNPGAWRITASLVKQYRINVIVDTGDTMDHGSAAENHFLDPASTLGAPYVWVRGNHDSRGTQKYLTGRRHVTVLDHGNVARVAGVRIAGVGDPQFTPDRSVVAAGDPAERTAGGRLADALRTQRLAGTPVDIALAHNPTAVTEADGLAPLALAGHVHHRENTLLPRGTRLMVEGSAGGGGLRAVQNKKPEPVQASVLYLDRGTKRLQAWDEITLGGLGLSRAEVSRHLPHGNQPGATPAPSGSPPSADPSSGRPSGPPPGASPRPARSPSDHPR